MMGTAWIDIQAWTIRRIDALAMRRALGRGLPAHLGWGSLFAQLDVIPIVGGHLDLVVAPHLSVNRPVIERAIASSYS